MKDKQFRTFIIVDALALPVMYTVLAVLLYTRSEREASVLFATLLACSWLAVALVVSRVCSRFGAEHHIEIATQCSRLMAVLISAVSAAAGVCWILMHVFYGSFLLPLEVALLLVIGTWMHAVTRPLVRHLCAQSGMMLSVGLTVMWEVVVALLVIVWLQPVLGINGAALLATTTGTCAGSAWVFLLINRGKRQEYKNLWAWSVLDYRIFRNCITDARQAIKRAKSISTLAMLGAQQRGLPGGRRVEIAPDRIIKRQSARDTLVEAAKLCSAVEVAKDTGAFRTPNVLRCDAEQGILEIERLFQVVPLGKLLRQEEYVRSLVPAAAKALAAIHNRLQLPLGLQRELPKQWRGKGNDFDVWIHGDFNTTNVLVDLATQQLAIIDWAASHRCGGQATRGPWCFDVAWFLASLFRTAPEPAAAAKLFLNTYCEARDPAVDPRECIYYLADTMNAIQNVKRKTTRFSTWLLGLRSMSETLSQLEQFARDNYKSERLAA